MARPNRTPFVLLGLLAAGGPQSGYQLKRAVEEMLAHFWRESYGQIYPALGRLEAEGLVARVPLRSPRGRQRRVFEITPAGRQALVAWLQQPAEPEVMRHELLLKVFLAAAADRAAALRQIRRDREEQRRRRDLLGRIEARLGGLRSAAPDVVHWLATVRYGALMTEARIRWCDEAEALIGGPGV